MIIVDEHGNDITSELNDKTYSKTVIINYKYEKIIRIKVSGEN